LGWLVESGRLPEDSENSPTDVNGDDKSDIKRYVGQGQTSFSLSTSLSLIVHQYQVRFWLASYRMFDYSHQAMDTQLFEQARQNRDPRFDGRFFIAVKTTGIYCRPICRVRIPKARNVQFFLTAAGAAEAGFRPCLRCRPETAPGTPAWKGTSTTVKRALCLISEGALDESGVESLGDRLGVTARHLSRLFSQHLGASPKAVGQTRRLHAAKKLLDETRLSMIDVAMASGYSSVRRFNDHFNQVYGRSPSQIRMMNKEAGRRQSSDLLTRGFLLKLAYRPPFDYQGMINFLKLRAIPGVEQVTEEKYVRTIVVGSTLQSQQVGRLTITHDSDKLCLQVYIELDSANQLMVVLEKVKRLFDLMADPIGIIQCLQVDKQMAVMVAQNPGQRVPGCWEPFEIAVRAIVGQQISVKGATTLMGKIAISYGQQTDVGLVFPDASALSQIDVTRLSMPVKRAQAIKDMSQAVVDGSVDFTVGSDPANLMHQLQNIKGIGPWTAQYIAMRALGDPDAFLQGDLVLVKVAKRCLGIECDKELVERSKQWQPYRAYACIHLWRQAARINDVSKNDG
jgi:AraC family transcriptional regulator of adaptative response / DNA-3-methyladenine glycosylase II